MTLLIKFCGLGFTHVPKWVPSLQPEPFVSHMPLVRISMSLQQEFTISLSPLGIGIIKPSNLSTARYERTLGQEF